jgi:hypothetical protein
MEKPNVRGPSPSRKADLALQQKLNGKAKSPPPLLEPMQEPAQNTVKNQADVNPLDNLPALAAKIRATLSVKPEIFITHPAELRILREMSDEQLRQFATENGWLIVRRIGGRQIEFYNDASVSAPL